MSIDSYVSVDRQLRKCRSLVKRVTFHVPNGPPYKTNTLSSETFIDNANRSGALANMNLTEFQNSMKHEKKLVILVWKHKTGATHGPVRIVKSPKLQSWMATFVKKVRCKLPGVADDQSEMAANIRSRILV